ncbi:MAG: hypothetical protein WA317_06945 [Mycobacterium sp.]
MVRETPRMMGVQEEFHLVDLTTRLACNARRQLAVLENMAG